MKPFTILNDLHEGAMRAAGTTPASAIALQQYGLYHLRKNLQEIDNDLIVLGDLLDGFQIPLSIANQVLDAFVEWLKKGHKLELVPGNHDLSTDSNKLSTFQFLASVLGRLSPNVKYHGSPTMLRDGVYVIPHMPNQDLFDLALSRVPECESLLLHCNFDNKFAKEFDHSLNLSMEAAAAVKAKRIVLAHEHTGRTAMAGKVQIIGNQFPMSISDCLDKQGKRRAVLTADGITYERTWDGYEYQEVSWKELETVRNDAMFIRVVGEAEEVEAAAAIEAVARLRRASKAYVIGSAVKVKSSGQELYMEEALSSVEDVREFDVMSVLREVLSKEQITVLETLK